VEAGRGLFTANCASCHGPQGQGGPAGPTLVGVGAASADFYLRTGRMPLSAPGQRVVRQAPHFDDPEIRSLVAYVASLGQGPGVPQVRGGGDIRKGWELFQANCAACHNATGSGNAVGGGFVAVGLGQADPATIAEATIIGPGAMPAFRFDDASIADLAAYVRWLADAPTPGGAAIGQTGPVAEGFVGVAVGLPLLLLVSLFVARHGHGPDDRGRTAAERGALTEEAPGDAVDDARHDGAGA
jgi:ubiquinol-cytochrome c reductase cytochrome c subunit